MVRAALWLEEEVGEGEVFSKERLRAAFPKVAQIDRRVRDLRAHDWQIDTSREDPSLRPDEQRYVRKGAEVWLPNMRGQKPKGSLTSAQRTQVMNADNHLCRSCGMAAGDLYENGVMSAQLDVTRRRVKRSDDTTEVQLVTECNRCRTGGRSTEADLARLLRTVERLAPLEREIFAGWLKAGSRKLNEVEKLWGEYRALPEDSRHAVQRAVGGDQKDGD